MTPPDTGPGRRGLGSLGTLSAGLRGQMPWIMLLVLVGVLAILLPHFLTPNNLLNILRQSSFIGVVAVGMSFVMIAGSFDLSVGSIMGLAAVILLKAQPVDAASMAEGVVTGLAAALAVGLVNGIAVGWMRTNSVIATIGTAFVTLGVTLIYSQSQNVTVLTTHPVIEYLSTGRVGRFPVPAILFLGIAAAGQIWLLVATYGRKLYATGGNSAAAALSGIPVGRIRITAYLISAGLAALAGMLMAARVRSINPTFGYGFEFDVLTAVMLGGMSLVGGRGSIMGTVAGVLILGVIGNGMTLSGIPYESQLLAKGAVLIIAVAIDEWLRPAWQQ